MTARELIDYLLTVPHDMIVVIGSDEYPPRDPQPQCKLSIDSGKEEVEL